MALRCFQNYRRWLSLSSSTSLCGKHSFGSFCLFVSPPRLGTEICTVQSCKSPVYRKSRATTAVRGKGRLPEGYRRVLCCLPRTSFSVQQGARPKNTTDSCSRSASSSAALCSIQLRLAGLPEIHVELHVEGPRAEPQTKAAHGRLVLVYR
jgi:hypothetical protein